MVTQPQGTYVDAHDQRLTSHIDPELHHDHTSPKKNVKGEIIRKLPRFVHLVNAGAFHFSLATIHANSRARMDTITGMGGLDNDNLFMEITNQTEK